ncbi:MAG: hypothetical protein ACLT5P_05465 [Flavonifractor plautii]
MIQIGGLASPAAIFAPVRRRTLCSADYAGGHCGRSAESYARQHFEIRAGRADGILPFSVFFQELDPSKVPGMRFSTPFPHFVRRVRPHGIKTPFTLPDYAGHPVVPIVIALLIVVGGIGFLT